MIANFVIDNDENRESLFKEGVDVSLKSLLQRDDCWKDQTFRSLHFSVIKSVFFSFLFLKENFCGAVGNLAAGNCELLRESLGFIPFLFISHFFFSQVDKAIFSKIYGILSSFVTDVKQARVNGLDDQIPAFETSSLLASKAFANLLESNNSATLMESMGIHISLPLICFQILNV